MPASQNNRRQDHAGETPRDARNPDDNLRIPAREGEPPRPATDPPHTDGSSRNDKTLTDPSTGEPSRRR